MNNNQFHVRHKNGSIQACRNFGPIIRMTEMNEKIADLKNENNREGEQDERAA